MDSPCRKFCELDNNDICKGCHRHINEINKWYIMSDDQRDKIMSRIAKERSNHKF